MRVMRYIHLSPGDWTGLAALVTGLFFLFVAPELVVIPLGLFLTLCVIAPFLPKFGFFLPVISKGRSGKRAVALTFDDGPDPWSTPRLLRLLKAHDMKATFFVVGEKAARYPGLISDILNQGHSIGNHSLTHDNLVMFKRRRTLKREIAVTQEILANLGIRPLAFRPPVGITYPGLGPVLSKAGLYALSFSCRAADGGNRWIKDLSGRILGKLHPDAIIALHDASSPDERLLSYWLDEMERILTGIREREFTVVPLSELVGRPVMEAVAAVPENKTV
ncbi:MAG: polysaccharide deacetylase family protein [Thermodesulfobacteriota bacterium]